MHKALHAILLDIYRATAGAPSSLFKDAVFSSMRRYLDFDAAGWGTFAVTSQGAKVHSVHVYQLPMQMMVDYEAVKQYDTLSAKALAKPGVTINVSIDNTRWKLHPEILAHVRKWGLDHSLGTIHWDPKLNLCHAISLYRGANSPPFTSKERILKQQLMIHMVEAWNMNAIRYVRQPDDAESQRDHALAVIDREGMIYNADAALHEILGKEFPDWIGPFLPSEMVQHVCAAEPLAFRGNCVTCNPIRQSVDGTILVSVRPVTDIDQLTAREAVAAKLFATGKSHKEIALEMKILPPTVRNHLQSVYRKLGVSHKIDLARRLGLP